MATKMKKVSREFPLAEKKMKNVSRGFPKGIVSGVPAGVEAAAKAMKSAANRGQQESRRQNPVQFSKYTNDSIKEKLENRKKTEQVLRNAFKKKK